MLIYGVGVYEWVLICSGCFSIGGLYYQVVGYSRDASFFSREVAE